MVRPLVLCRCKKLTHYRRAVALRASCYVLALYTDFIFISVANTDANVAYTLLSNAFKRKSYY